MPESRPYACIRDVLGYVYTKIRKIVKKIIKTIIKPGSLPWVNISKIEDLFRSMLILKPPTPPISFHRIIESFSSMHKDIFFIEVGANDGVTDDPISEFITRDHWSGIMVEPVKYLFDELVSHYKIRENLIFENAAIAERNGVMDFYYYRKTEKIPKWCGGGGSLIKEGFQNKPDYMQYLVTEKVKCVTLEALLQKYNVKHVHLFLIDTEGYDYKIIKQMDFTKIKPNVILYEDMNLTVNDYNDCIRYLRKNGYQLYKEGYNILGLYGVDM